jgi:hypothetical protein
MHIPTQNVGADHTIQSHAAARSESQQIRSTLQAAIQVRA